MALLRLSCLADMQNSEVRAFACRIRDSFAALDKELQMLCADTCTECRAVCCLTATVWYDFRDLLVLAVTGDWFPEQQISRKTDHSCSHLGPQGCNVPRARRPFICTWYICSVQQNVLNTGEWKLRRSFLLQQIAAMKQQRKLLEQLCVETVCR